MIFAGLQKTSLIDYPGKVSCVVFITGCNLACPFCHNPELALGRYPQRISLDQFLQYLAPRRHLLDGVVVSGGEPTLASGLEEICRAVRDVGLPVKLDTNGTRPEVLARLIRDELLDYIALDVKTTLERYAPDLANNAGIGLRVGESIQLIMQSGLAYEFRTTCVRPFVDDEIIAAIARAIQGARRYILQAFRPAVLLKPAFFGQDPPGFSPQAMERLRLTAAPWVADCLVRG
ncbi:MAG: anaerobic ribonucleoside-triphosphate reductase activating protein [Desulfobacteraceae bacterium]|nr:MAG: anaerobic ribonucleoside-triphosphate reductase activating protein [Desulfobacteraceae bacterium]